ncbi:fibronectin type III domain-containing protein [Marinitoga sp. 38H-ov]|uniref:fibronectin type III domain-containing protein n=1 Tax=Marinitoga sp. 38H-ov TaxID=1755814 RepID=UPI0013EB4E34|nr:fibronectin type III domain-containing protein [Marinitoga sp. 38H-ov]KAF2955252.1 hypothetical protein AS160_01760 [Marinitoga sp. 38H-ov]
MKWEISDNKKYTYDLYLGETNPPQLFGSNIPSNIYPLKLLKPSTTYYWKVVAKERINKYESPIWSFTTRDYYNGELIWVSIIKNSQKILYSDNYVINAYDNNIDIYNPYRDIVYNLKTDFKDILVNNDLLYILKNNSIEIYNFKSGKTVKSITLNKSYENIYLKKDNLILYSKNSIDVYDNNYKEILNLNFDNTIKNLYLLNNFFIVNLDNKIIIFDYSGKTIKEYKISANLIGLNSNFMLLKISDVLYVLSYDNQMYKIDDNVKYAHLNDNFIFIEKDQKLIIYNINTKKRNTIYLDFTFNKALFFENNIILIGDKIYCIDYSGNILWKQDFNAQTIKSNIITTDRNTIIFSLNDGTYNKIIELFENDLIDVSINLKSLDLKFENNIIPVIKDTKLPTPILLNPKNNEKISNFTTTLSWTLPEYDNESVTFEIQLKAITNGIMKNILLNNIKKNNILIQLEPNTKYFWKVIAIENNQRTESNWSTFFTDDLSFVFKRIKITNAQMIANAKIVNDIIYFTGYTQKENSLNLLYGQINTNFLNLKAWDFSNNKYGQAIDITNEGTILIGGFSAENEIRGDMLLYSLTSDGKVIWNSESGGSKRDSINDILYDDNYLYYIGTIGTDNMETNIQFAKYNLNGYRIWSRDFGGYELEFGSKVKRIDKYSFVLLGTTKSFGEGGYDYYIIKTNELGQKIWDLTIGTSKDDFASDILILTKNEYIILGTSFGDTLQPLISKIDSNGYKIFEKTIPFVNDVNLIKAVLYKNYIYSVGWFRYNNSIQRTGIITKFDINGNLIFAKTFDIDNQDTVFTDLIIKDNKFFLIGFSEYPEPNSRDIILIQTNEDYILNNFKEAK